MLERAMVLQLQLRSGEAVAPSCQAVIQHSTSTVRTPDPAAAQFHVHVVYQQLANCCSYARLAAGLFFCCSKLGLEASKPYRCSTEL